MQIPHARAVDALAPATPSPDRGEDTAADSVLAGQGDDAGANEKANDDSVDVDSPDVDKGRTPLEEAEAVPEEQATVDVSE